ncbi:hypothetical protein ACJX0J_026086, partial [Zea mays]
MRTVNVRYTMLGRLLKSTLSVSTGRTCLYVYVSHGYIFGLFSIIIYVMEMLSHAHVKCEKWDSGDMSIKIYTLPSCGNKNRKEKEQEKKKNKTHAHVKCEKWDSGDMSRKLCPGVPV